MNAGHGYATGVYVMGVIPQGRGTPEVTSIREHVTRGDFRFSSHDGTRHGVVLGKLLASRLNVWPGDKINLVSVAGVQQNAATGTFVPNLYPFEVTGIFDTGMYEYDNAYVYIDLPAAQDFAGLGDAVTGIEVKTRDRWEAKALGERITTTLGFPYRSVDWEEQNHSLFQALKLEKLGMSVILLLIVIVAAFNIVSTLTMVVTDKTREIGILKAMGMTSGAIRNIFFVQGVFIGAVGTGLGTIIGFAAELALDRYKFIRLDPQVYFIDHLPVNTQMSDVLGIVTASLVIAALATLYPAMQAARDVPCGRHPVGVMPPVLEARDVHKRYIGGDGSPLNVLQGVNLTVAAGEMVAIIGESGSGNSTLLHILGALDRPTSGQVLLSGRMLTEQTDDQLALVRNRSVGFVFQFHHLLREFTSLENVSMPLRIAGASRSDADARARELLMRVGLGTRLQHRPGELSGGEQQRAAVARALAVQPGGGVGR